jgi:hypothetical protein
MGVEPIASRIVCIFITDSLEKLITVTRNMAQVNRLRDSLFVTRQWV